MTTIEAAQALQSLAAAMRQGGVTSIEVDPRLFIIALRAGLIEWEHHGRELSKAPTFDGATVRVRAAA